jgi:hypothetical protein
MMQQRTKLKRTLKTLAQKVEFHACLKAFVTNWHQLAAALNVCLLTHLNRSLSHSVGVKLCWCWAICSRSVQSPASLMSCDSCCTCCADAAAVGGTVLVPGCAAAAAAVEGGVLPV